MDNRVYLANEIQRSNVIAAATPLLKAIWDMSDDDAANVIVVAMVGRIMASFPRLSDTSARNARVDAIAEAVKKSMKEYGNV